MAEITGGIEPQKNHGVRVRPFLFFLLIAGVFFAGAAAGIFGYILISGSSVHDISVSEIPGTEPESSPKYQPVYHWTYNGQPYTLTLSLPEDMYTYYRSLGHSTVNMAKYVTDSYNRKIAAKIAESVLKEADLRGFTPYQTMMFLVSFVQSVTYADDLVSTGKDEYARYPVETLVDRVGDCEDTSILCAAVLLEMGYQVVLISMEDHVAVGVRKDGMPMSGTFVTVNGEKYYYLETTGLNWDAGEVPDIYSDRNVTVIPLT